jgi:hypothetical protein
MSPSTTVRTRQNESVLSLSARAGEEERKDRLGDLRDCFRLLPTAAGCVPVCLLVLLRGCCCMTDGYVNRRDARLSWKARSTGQKICSPSLT